MAASASYILAPALGVLVPLVLAGCGGGTGDSTSSSTASAAVAPASGTTTTGGATTHYPTQAKPLP